MNLATGVPLNQAISATFSEAMNDTTINTTTFTLVQGTTPIPGVVAYIAGQQHSNLYPNQQSRSRYNLHCHDYNRGIRPGGQFLGK